MNTVTFETAKRLKEAGFPQPEPEAGQVWYANDMNIWASVVHVGGRAVNHVNHGYMLVYSTPIREFKTACIFAPTATDILEQLPDNFYIRKTTYEKSPIFSIFNEAEIGDSFEANFSKGVNKNPAEAAALAWLKIHDAE